MIYVEQDKVYIFGGEYATLDQFHHYRDMWALDLKTNIWEEVPASKVCVCVSCPSASAWQSSYPVSCIFCADRLLSRMLD